ncbi:glycosyltransferase [Cetobacterium sp. 8H]|uniref:glycosyltransferase family 2 protein n=1 Tax=Cetobacterium sp. 8H TaxID=2759681 RepID=UPI00163C527F|nr:glycosyltransferase [Cetobacterium sp. 8H]MBC2850905.1 glycosyltransferase [Cetobacterium sp. 8H]
MEEEILVSICCITYNHEEFIEDALKGFLNQKVNFNYEILIHEDASTDRTAEILRRYEQKYPKLIKVIYQTENQYSKSDFVSKFLYDISRAKYLAICEGDDYWVDENKLQKQVDFLEKNLDYSAYYHNVIVVDRNKNKFSEDQEIYKLYKTHTLKSEDINTGDVPGQTASLVYRNFWKDLNQESKEKFGKCKSNGDTKLALFLNSIGKIYFSEDIMSHYRLTFDTDSWNSKMKNQNPCMYLFNGLFEIKTMLKEVLNIDYEPNLELLTRESFRFAVKSPTLKNIKTFIEIYRKCQNKNKIMIIIESILKKIKIIKEIKENNRPLLK